MKSRMQARSMLSKRMKDMLDRVTTPIYGEGRDDSLLKVIGDKPAAEYKKARRLEEIESVKGDYTV